VQEKLKKFILKLNVEKDAAMLTSR